MKRALHSILVALYGMVPLVAEPVVLSQDDILARVEAHELVLQSGIMLEMRSADLAAVSGWNGAQVTLAPTMEYGNATGDYLVSEAGAGFDILFPLGTSRTELEKRLAAAELVDIARLELKDATGKAYAELFRLYAASYTAQENITVVEQELELARLKMESIQQKTARGLANISEQADAEYAFQTATEKVIQAQLEARLSWFSLANLAGLGIDKPGLGTPQADHPSSMDSGTVELPRFAPLALQGVAGMELLPGVLIAKAKDGSPLLEAQSQRLAAATRAVNDYSALNLNFSPKLLVSVPSASASIGYGTAAGSLALGADWTPYTNPQKTVPAGTSFTFSVGVSGSVNPQATAEKAALEAQAKLEERKLQALLQGIELSVRSKYATWLKSKDSLQEAARSNQQALESSEALKARRALGQLSPEDEAANEVVLLRTAFTLEKAEMAVAQAYLDMMAAASSLDPAQINLKGAAK